MSHTIEHLVVTEADSEGTFIRLPDGWLIEPIGADVSITVDHETGKYLVRPLIGDDGLPTSKFIFPENDVP